MPIVSYLTVQQIVFIQSYVDIARPSLSTTPLRPLKKYPGFINMQNAETFQNLVREGAFFGSLIV